MAFRVSQPNTFPQLSETVQAALLSRFGREAQWLVAAPGRVNLIGEHTDYNDGFVLPMAIEHFTFIAAASNSTRLAHLHSLSANETVTLDLSQPITRMDTHWSNYVRGVLAEFQRLGVSIPGFDSVIGSNVPLGGGLSSSAALEVATATLLEAMTGHTLEPLANALLCQRAEHEFAQMPCGIMDQFASVMARENHLLLLDCRSQQSEFIPFTDPAVAILIINSQVKHELAGSEYALRRADCEQAARLLDVRSLREVSLRELSVREARLSPQIYRRAHHVVSEIERTVQAAKHIQASEWCAAGELMYASHASLRDDFAVSCRELDLLVELAQGIGERGGVYGSRMTGGGFGGCTVSLVDAQRADAISHVLCTAYEAATGIKPAAFVTRPAGGAKVLSATTKK